MRIGLTRLRVRIVAKVLFDHNMPPSMARALHEVISAAGHESWPLRAKFDTNISDIDLYERLGKERDWIVISKDVSQAKRPPERAAILKFGVVALYLATSVEKLAPHQQLATILWHWDAIVRQRASQANGLFLLPINKGSRFRSL
jgi:PIN like domain